MGKKNRAERQAAAKEYNKSRKNRTAAKSNRTDTIADLAKTVQFAANFLTAGEACPDQAQRDSGLKPALIKKIGLGRISPNSDQIEKIHIAATNQGWKAAVNDGV